MSEGQIKLWLSKQIEHWTKIGRIAEDNPDLPYSFILDSLLAKRKLIG
ncbi:hypothetical protein CE143_10055 [Photorhabdus luminescens]|uniref:Uncharacterized protein n=1 Tax=Photorhabdus akhurstii TaxID=171438 RepID=A0ABX8M0Z2_9GAMM|nr:hypothetical protein C6H69_03395 [Photorhabdus luminescens]QXF36206.1 hypothetical protein B0X70_10145 [Photorhabdus akhurstii]UJD78049.1 hypothetical protein CE143_10055 [Photorhabdus luminescens]